MTNAEKYLKDGITAEEFVKAVWGSCYNIPEAEGDKNYKNCMMYGATIERWLNEETRPTLTEDERVILRNIDISNYKGIGRKNDTLYLVSATPNFFGGEDDKEVFWYCFHELFQFIKERRRI